MDEGRGHAENRPASTGGKDADLARPGPWLPSGAMTVVAALLTACSAAADVAAFSRLGGVFASVMTSNIVFLGLAAARTSAALAVHAAVSFLGYVCGVAAGARITGGEHGNPGRSRQDSHDPARWPLRIIVALLTEIGLFIAFTAGWELTGARPAGGAQLAILGIVTAAMGVQSATVLSMRLAGVSTTYMTGTLTTLVTAIASPSPQARAGHRRPTALLALAAGAGIGGVLLAYAAPVVPAIPFVTLSGVLVMGSGWLRPTRRRLFAHTRFHCFCATARVVCITVLTPRFKSVPCGNCLLPDSIRGTGPGGLASQSIHHSNG